MLTPGWYPDPDDPTARRYWDGNSWSAPLPTQHAPVDEATIEAPPESPAAPHQKRTLIVSGAAVLVLLAAAVTALLLKRSSDDDDRRAAAAASSSSASSEASISSENEAALAEASAAEASSSAQKEADDLQRSFRQTIISALETSVTKDAKKDVRDGLLDGPIKRTECTPVGGGSTDILTDTTSEFRCIAVNKSNKDGTEEGYRFAATVNWNDGSYSWHLGD